MALISLATRLCLNSQAICFSAVGRDRSTLSVDWPCLKARKLGVLLLSTLRIHHQLLHNETGRTLQRVQLTRLTRDGVYVWMAHN